MRLHHPGRDGSAYPPLPRRVTADAPPMRLSRNRQSPLSRTYWIAPWPHSAVMAANRRGPEFAVQRRIPIQRDLLIEMGRDIVAPRRRKRLAQVRLEQDPPQHASKAFGRTLGQKEL